MLINEKELQRFEHKGEWFTLRNSDNWETYQALLCGYMTEQRDYFLSLANDAHTGALGEVGEEFRSNIEAEATQRILDPPQLTKHELWIFSSKLAGLAYMLASSCPEIKARAIAANQTAVEYAKKMIADFSPGKEIIVWLQCRVASGLMDSSELETIIDVKAS